MKCLTCNKNLKYLRVQIQRMLAPNSITQKHEPSLFVIILCTFAFHQPVSVVGRRVKASFEQLVSLCCSNKSGTLFTPCGTIGQIKMFDPINFSAVLWRQILVMNKLSDKLDGWQVAKVQISLMFLSISCLGYLFPRD